MAKELGLIDKNVINKKITLNQLRYVFSEHKSFKNKTKLEILADNYQVLIKYSPKFDCELNPIEGVWGYMKCHIRKHTDQTYKKLLELFPESLVYFKHRDVQIGLWRRFWNCLIAYNKGLSYQEVLRKYFGHNRKSEIINHRRI